MAEDLNLPDELDESYTGADELPSQGGGFVPTILPGKHFFRLPSDLSQCWVSKEYEKRDADKNVITDAEGKPVMETHLLLKFDADRPLVCEENSEFDGIPLRAVITTIPRKRGKGDNARSAHDLTYFLREALNDKTTVIQRKADWIPAINAHAGELVRLTTGLEAQCDPERKRYVATEDPPNANLDSIEDPDGYSGCGAANGFEKQTTEEIEAGVPAKPKKGRVYTQAFKVTEEVEGEDGKMTKVTRFRDRVQCQNPNCGAILRGFTRIEKFEKPLASTQQVQG